MVKFEVICIAMPYEKSSIIIVCFETRKNGSADIRKSYTYTHAQTPKHERTDTRVACGYI